MILSLQSVVGNLVIVHDLNLLGTTFGPPEANSVLVVDPNRVLSLSAPHQCLKA
jgi:hypothetical protein